AMGRPGCASGTGRADCDVDGTGNGADAAAPTAMSRQRIFAGPVLLRSLLLVVATSVLALLLGFLWFVAGLPQQVEDPQSRTDAIVVLTGGSDRLETGFDLLERGLARRLFVSGVGPAVHLDALLAPTNRPGASLGCCVVLGHEADDTIGNARETAAWMRREGLGSLRLVTAQYHMPRSVLAFRRTMPDVQIIAHPVFPAAV